ncbi:MAG: TetR/AcrR family transcriptional regulator [Stackebrandtia sp.]
MSDTKQRILAVAKELILAAGSQAVSMRKIGTSIGVTPMAVYRHFPNREALLSRLADDCFNELAATWSTVAFPDDVLEGSQVIVDLFIDVAMESPGLFSFLFIEERHGARRFPDDFSGGESPTFRLLGAHISTAIADGRLRNIEQWRIALAHTALIHGLTQMYLGGRINLPGADFRKLCHDMTELLVNGLTPR